MEISIHAPREGCDSQRIKASGLDTYFNPRTPRGVRPPWRTMSSTILQFQSTHPARGATIGIILYGHILGISIHAPREGCDVVKH